MAAGSRLGIALCEPHTRAFGAPVVANGLRGLNLHLDLVK